MAKTWEPSWWNRIWPFVQSLAGQPIASAPTNPQHQHLQASLDPRNLTDEFKGLGVEEIRARLEARRRPFATLLLNIDYDINIATIIRNHNAFCGKNLYYLGRKKYNRRGTVGTYHYEKITNFQDLKGARKGIDPKYTWVGLDNRPGAIPLPLFQWPDNPMIVLGHENQGLDFIPELAYNCKYLVSIPQAGSVRSMNVAVAAGIAMYDLCWKKGWLNAGGPDSVPPPIPKQPISNNPEDLWG